MKSKLYSPYQISKMPDAEIRKAYSDLRSVANKRLGRLEAQGLNQTARSGYRFPTIKQVESSSKSTVASELADVSVWLRDERSTVRGEKAFMREFIETMKEHDYGDIIQSYDDAYEFFDFMEEVRQNHQELQVRGSDVLDAMQEAERLNIPRDKLMENIEQFVANLEDLKNVQPTKGGRTFSSSRIDSLIRRWTK